MKKSANDTSPRGNESVVENKNCTSYFQKKKKKKNNKKERDNQRIISVRNNARQYRRVYQSQFSLTNVTNIRDWCRNKIDKKREKKQDQTRKKKKRNALSLHLAYFNCVSRGETGDNMDERDDYDRKIEIFVDLR